MTKRNTETRRIVFERSNVRIERISDRYYAEYITYVSDQYQGSYSTLLEAEQAANAAAYDAAAAADPQMAYNIFYDDGDYAVAYNDEIIGAAPTYADADEIVSAHIARRTR